ncbi:hypothetical protein CHH28_14865 [Bacterioplanes sanyensis]|uniref:Endolytic murein transglycosylase n=1 Tax=Bacterioplanes sanyensis TaxID=1249553 RepID=A0A222FLH8_9GAMM|nr:endolytic transglycosylase MltG [Bacterioplanes sanyensis]ASP39875.1 hypothetical protein CHH28_14865 [Bacterioplanes sanyensis]
MRIAAVLLVLVVGLALAAWYVPSTNHESVRVDIQHGDTLAAKSRQWQQDGWLPSATLLRIQARLLDKERILRVGEFDIPAGVTGAQLLGLLETAAPVTYRVTLIEGTRLEEALLALSSAPKLQQDVTPLTPAQVAMVLGIQGSAEGLLYPDTYVYPSGERVSRLLRQAHQRLQAELEQAWEQRHKDLPLAKPYDALVLASVVEKETGAPWERAQIAGVFVRRLQQNMRLQTDPTVIYGLGKDFDGNLRRRHLRDGANPYNTYRHKGLPPTPIALAGRAALMAAVQPQDGKALYFVAKGDGTHVFSETLEQHNKAVRHYQITRRKENYRSSPVTQEKP